MSVLPGAGSCWPATAPRTRLSPAGGSQAQKGAARASSSSRLARRALPTPGVCILGTQVPDSAEINTEFRG